jgi:5-methyltetrahydrofolate--homocysteine methyltransferase
MKRITEEVAQGRVLVSDGAWGTFLQKKGLQPGECPELWCVTHREAVKSIPTSYIDVGADMVKSNSFGGTRCKLQHYGLADRVAELNEAAASISREAAGPNRHVLASIGPTGKMLLMGDVTEEELYAAFKEQAVALERGGADACLIETFAALDEAALAVKAARENTKLEVAVTFTFERTLQGEYRTMMGVSPSDMAAAMLEAGADIIGANCGNGMERMAEIIREMRRAAPLAALLVHANAGTPVRVNGADTFPESPADTAKYAGAVIAAGAGIIGGCCGTTPEHIRALVNLVRSRGGPVS